MNIANYIVPVSGVAVGVVGVICLGWLNILKQTNALLKEQNAELKETNKDLLDKHSANLVSIASLQGQIDVLKSIPLMSIDTSLKLMAKTNDKILQTLRSSASTLARDTKDAADAAERVRVIAAEDRDVLTNQNKHIHTEVHKIIDKK